MQGDIKIQTLIFLFIFNSIVILLVVLSNNINAQDEQELHKDTLYEISKKLSPKQNPHIAVGKSPSAITVEGSGFDDKAYVVNHDDNSVSVIGINNNSKIGNDIPVGKSPVAIVADIVLDKLYVVNHGDDSISVIDMNNNSKIEMIFLLGPTLRL